MTFKRSLCASLGVVLLSMSVFLAACANGPTPERIVLKTARLGGFLWLGLDNPVYVLDANRGGEISWKLPPGLGDEPDWSPDGQWITFSTSQIDAQAGHWSHIYAMRSDGTQRTTIAEEGSDPAWSPDGNQIAYRLSNANEIYLLDAVCVKENRNCQPPVLLGLGGRPTWSPDGKQIVYNALRSDDYTSDGIVLLTLETKTTFKLPGSDGCYNPRWSPASRRIVAACKESITIFAPDGSTSTQLLGIAGGGPKWSPDGKRITFVASSQYDQSLGKGLNGEGDVRSDAIFVMNADGTDVHRLSLRNDEEVLWYSWMP